MSENKKARKKADREEREARLKTVPKGASPDDMRLAEALMKESPRGMILIGVARIDESLERLLALCFLDDADVRDRLLKVERPLGTLSSRIDLAYLLGLVSLKARQSLHTMREIRNKAAHDHNSTLFDDSAIKDQVASLTVVGATIKRFFPDSRGQLAFAMSHMIDYLDHAMRAVQRANPRDDQPLVWDLDHVPLPKNP